MKEKPEETLKKLGINFDPATRKLLDQYANWVDYIIAGADTGFNKTEEGKKAMNLVNTNHDAQLYVDFLVRVRRHEVTKAFLEHIGLNIGIENAQGE